MSGLSPPGSQVQDGAAARAPARVRSQTRLVDRCRSGLQGFESGSSIPPPARSGSRPCSAQVERSGSDERMRLPPSSSAGGGHRELVDDVVRTVRGCGATRELANRSRVARSTAGISAAACFSSAPLDLRAVLASAGAIDQRPRAGATARYAATDPCRGGPTTRRLLPDDYPWRSSSSRSSRSSSARLRESRGRWWRLVELGVGRL